MLTPTQLQQGLRQHTGSLRYYQHPNSLIAKAIDVAAGDVWYSEGVRYLQTNAECHWLIDAIASHVSNDTLPQDMQFWMFRRGNPSILTVTDGNSNTHLLTQEFTHTDFPLGEIELLAQYDGDRWVICLMSEY